MSFVVEAIEDVVDFVGDAVEVVGDVIEGAVKVAGDVIETVAENPLLLAAAIAAPYAYGALMGSSAAAGTGISLAGASTGSGLAFAPTLGAGIGSTGITSAGIGAFGGSMGISAGAIGAAAAGTALAGSTFGTATMLDPFNFPSVTEATNFNTGVLEASNESLMTFNESQTVASSAMGNQPSFAFNTDYTSSSFFNEAKEAASLVKSPGISFSNALETATGTIPNSSTSIFAQAWDSAKGVVSTIKDVNAQADKLLNSIGNVIAPGADPLIQKTITNTAVNTVANGGDVGEALKGSIIGTGAGLAGSTVAGATADTLGKTGANMLGSAAANATGTALTGGDIGASLINSGIGAGTGLAGKTVTDLTGSSLLGGAAKTAVGTGIRGGDVGNALLNYGTNTAVNTGTSYLNDLLKTNNVSPKSPLGMITNAVTPSLTNMVTGAPPPSVASMLKSSGLTKTISSNLLPKTNAPTVLAATQPKTTTAPPQKVDVSTLKPITDISSLIGKKP